jgi:hypothetical protein
LSGSLLHNFWKLFNRQILLQFLPLEKWVSVYVLHAQFPADLVVQILTVSEESIRNDTATSAY